MADRAVALPDYRPRRVVVASSTVATVGALPVFLLGGMAVQVRHSLHFGVAALGAAVTVFFASSAAGSAPLGRLAERLGARTSLRIAAAVSAISMLGMAALARTWLGLLPFLFIGGLANSFAGPAANLAIARNVDPSRRCLSISIKQSSIPAATLLAGIAVPAVALHDGWRTAFYGGGVLAAFASVVLAPLVGEPQSAARRVGVNQPRTFTATLGVLALAATLGAAPANALGAFTVDSAVTSGTSPRDAAMLLMLGSVVGLCVRLLGGWWGDRAGHGRLLAVSVLLAVGSVGFAALALPQFGVGVLAVVVSFGAGWGWPGLFQFAVVNSHSQTPAAATGVTQVGSYAGAAAGPFLFGLLASHETYTFAWAAAAATALAAAGLVLYARGRLLEIR